MQSTSDASNAGNVISYVDVADTRQGACYELNTSGGENGELSGTWFHHNTGRKCRSGLEIYGCSAGTCVGSNDALVENNYFDNTDYRGGLGGGAEDCITAGYTSSGNVVINNVCVNHADDTTVPILGVRNSTGNNLAHGFGNKFYNNTVINDSSISALSGVNQGALGDGNSGATGGAAHENEFKNNVVYLANGGKCANSKFTDNIFDGNMCYSSGTAWKWDNTDKATLALWQSAYNASTGLTDTSTEDDPEVDLTYTIGYPKSTSPAIGAGIDLDITTDKRGKPRSNTPSIGAYEYTTGIDVF
jgi:hypothetical protein